jgi:DNA-binding XRE family transcriptional regulator
MATPPPSDLTEAPADHLIMQTMTRNGGVRLLARRIDRPSGDSDRDGQGNGGTAARRRRQLRPTRGPLGEVRWWERPPPGGHEAMWQAVQRLQRRRQQLGLSVTELARRLTDSGHPISRETLSRVLNGKQPTSWHTVELMAEVLSADLPELFDER